MSLFFPIKKKNQLVIRQCTSNTPATLEIMFMLFHVYAFAYCNLINNNSTQLCPVACTWTVSCTFSIGHVIQNSPILCLCSYMQLDMGRVVSQHLVPTYMYMTLYNCYHTWAAAEHKKQSPIHTHVASTCNCRQSLGTLYVTLWLGFCVWVLVHVQTN